MSSTELKRILVADDETDIQELVQLTLETEGYEVVTADNGLAALESVASSTPDLIILDMKMPVMDGWAFAREFHTRYDHQVPIIVMTAADDARARAREIGASGWIGKPFDLDVLIQTVGRHLQP